MKIEDFLALAKKHNWVVTLRFMARPSGRRSPWIGRAKPALGAWSYYGWTPTRKENLPHPTQTYGMIVVYGETAEEALQKLADTYEKLNTKVEEE